LPCDAILPVHERIVLLLLAWKAPLEDRQTRTISIHFFCATILEAQTAGLAAKIGTVAKLLDDSDKADMVVDFQPSPD
jgi:hypothetical protein